MAKMSPVGADDWDCRATSVLSEIRHRERREERRDDQDSKVLCWSFALRSVVG